MRNGFIENVTDLKNNKPSIVPHCSGVKISCAQQDVYLALVPPSSLTGSVLPSSSCRSSKPLVSSFTHVVKSSALSLTLLWGQIWTLHHGKDSLSCRMDSLSHETDFTVSLTFLGRQASFYPHLIIFLSPELAHSGRYHMDDSWSMFIFLMNCKGLCFSILCPCLRHREGTLRATQ